MKIQEVGFRLFEEVPKQEVIIYVDRKGVYCLYI